jgi:hypothetical protein
MTTIYFSLSIIFIMSSLHALYSPNERALKTRMFREYSKEFEIARQKAVEQGLL